MLQITRRRIGSYLLTYNFSSVTADTYHEAKHATGGFLGLLHSKTRSSGIVPPPPKVCISLCSVKNGKLTPFFFWAPFLREKSLSQTLFSRKRTSSVCERHNTALVGLQTIDGPLVCNSHLSSLHCTAPHH